MDTRTQEASLYYGSVLPMLAVLARAKVAWASLNTNIYVEREYAWDAGFVSDNDSDNYYLLLRAKLTELAPMLHDHTALTLVCCGSSLSATAFLLAAILNGYSFTVQLVGGRTLNACFTCLYKHNSIHQATKASISVQGWHIRTTWQRPC